MKKTMTHTSPLMRWHRMKQLGLFGCLALFALFHLAGCQSFKNAMYLKKGRAGDFYNKQQTALSPAQANERARMRKLVATMPDSNRVLGGFCTDKQVIASLDEVRKLGDDCRNRLTDFADQAHLQGRLYWGFLIASIATGAGMIIGGLAPSDPEVKGWLAFSFGSATLTLSLINGLGGFDGRQTVLTMQAKKLDNLMWTMRLRILAEVCNAKNVTLARRQAAQIARMTRNMCVANPKDDGVYHIPTRSSKK